MISILIPCYNYNRNETIGKKIREAELSKVPYMLILGEKEAEMENVSVRKHREGDMGEMTVENFIELIQLEISKSISKFEN
jgi:threonyl-tRNA synthetase